MVFGVKIVNKFTLFTIKNLMLENKQSHQQFPGQQCTVYIMSHINSQSAVSHVHRQFDLTLCRKQTPTK